MDRCFEVKARLVEQLDLPFLNWVHTIQRATRTLVDGDPDAGEQLAQEAMRLGSEGGQPDVGHRLRDPAHHGAAAAGHTGDVGPAHRAGGEGEPGISGLHRRPGVGPLRGRSIRRGSAACSTVSPVRASRLPLDVAWLTAMIACAEAAAACGDPRYARAPARPAGAVRRPMALHRCLGVGPGEPHRGRPADEPRALRRSGEALLRGPCLRHVGGRLVLHGPNRLLLGADAGAARRSRGPGQGAAPSHSSSRLSRRRAATAPCDATWRRSGPLERIGP